MKTKKQIKEMCKRTFEWGKNNVYDNLFEEYFEEMWKEEQSSGDKK